MSRRTTERPRATPQQAHDGTGMNNQASETVNATDVRSGSANPQRSTASGPPREGRGTGRVARTIALLAVASAVAWSYGPNLTDLIQTWSNEPNYSHGFLVFPVALVILWQRMRGADPAAGKPCAWGWGGLALLLTARALFYDWGVEWRETATLPLVLVGLTLTWGGWPLLRRVWPALAFLVFMLPLPPKINGALAQPLQHLATVGTCVLSKLTGLWVVPQGNIILVGKEALEVAEACNGLSMLMCLAATVTATSILLPVALWKRIVLLASIVPVALLTNILRITATAWCYDSLGVEAGRRYAHDVAGWLMMPTALLLVGLELTTLSWVIVAEKG